MKHILFTHSYFLRFDPKQWEAGQPYPPLGTLYAASVMRQAGFDCRLFDSMFLSDPRAISKAIDDNGPSFVVIYDDGFNYLTKMCLTNMREAAFSMCRIAREKGCTVIVSSSDATDHYEKYLEAGAGFVLLGEAEHTLLELVNAVDSGNPFQQIPGLAYRDGENIIKTARRPVIRDLDSLPMPAWDLLDISPYRAAWLKSSNYFSLNIGTTRGCPFKCNWCAKPIYGNRYNSRSPQHVVNELIYLKQNFGFDHIWFCDDIFGLKPGWVQEFAELVQSTGLKFRFKIQSRADLLVQENYVEALAAAGCDNVWMGAESGSQRILDAMDKGITIAQIHTATALLKKHGIRPSFFIQFGYLSETRKDIRKTIDMINTLLPHSIGISVSYPLPGTGFYEKVKQDLQEKSNWTDSDELQLMFRNTFQPAFYKQLHRYVHRSHRSHLALDHWRQLVLKPRRTNLFRIKKALSILYYFPALLMARWQVNRLAREVHA
ncbi:MAG: B12-binding domain-containing radical SAM protein [Chitinophagaceae bacterium]|nr:B12-binding domain-containing radical SAM protein [Chitinophagaceae bacterium]